MRAMVISGGGSKGAFAGGVAHYLNEKKGHAYDLYLGTSTGSLLISHFGLQKLEKIKEIFTSVSNTTIFSKNPFSAKKSNRKGEVRLDVWNLLNNLYRGHKTLGESLALLDVIRDCISSEEFLELKNSNKDIVITVSNISKNHVEYKSIKECSYDEFCEWIWISCNFIPFMSLVNKNGCDYADGCFGNMFPLEEAIKRGATEIDAILLRTEVPQQSRVASNNLFSCITNVLSFMMDRLEHQNVLVGKYAAQYRNVTINYYFTPYALTSNSLNFDCDQMSQWWDLGYDCAKTKDTENGQAVQDLLMCSNQEMALQTSY